jgi:hypothetical protein
LLNISTSSAELGAIFIEIASRFDVSLRQTVQSQSELTEIDLRNLPFAQTNGRREAKVEFSVRPSLSRVDIQTK